jgi:hypothetical protein
MSAHDWLVLVIVPIVGLILDYRNTQRSTKIEVSIDGRMDQLLEAARVIAHAKGVTDEKENAEKNKGKKLK